ncbi:PREDICTED: cytochrome P450 76C1-like [Ipomoea nil]|uniref:cytochrome P450 76C1-like n=1 Tax=Ipomoea nil TaxID=35883 RepID=UPI000900B10F|nr:PREDICTED: cytochrome P450 76C1-like [Ipomoea nil]
MGKRSANKCYTWDGDLSGLQTTIKQKESRHQHMGHINFHDIKGDQGIFRGYSPNSRAFSVDSGMESMNVVIDDTISTITTNDDESPRVVETTVPTPLTTVMQDHKIETEPDEDKRDLNQGIKTKVKKQDYRKMEEGYYYYYTSKFEPKNIDEALNFITKLLYNPEIMKKVQKELEEIVGMTSILEEVHLQKLKYLDVVVKETFRLYKAVPLLIPKCPSQTTQVGGYTIPKDARVFLNMYAIHRDRKLWDNPFQFSPKRFLNETFGLDYTGNDYRFLPFGWGRRICGGISWAKKMLIYILSSMLHSFNWHFPEGEKMDLSGGLIGLVIKKNTSLVAIPVPRLSNSELYQ